MANVKTKLMNAFEALKKEGKKISPYAVEKRAGVANGSCKNHPALLDMILAEKAHFHANPQVVNKGLPTKKKQVDKKKHDDLVESNKRLRAENDQFREEMKVMATSVAQLTWELHRYKTATKGNSDKFRSIKV
ncbi:hypothetical protein H5123_16130 [Shewanella sp. SR43-4]|jgi:hypothetical protein|uniref:hypothetical protein n=1 Tax=Shewanella sp. SR43-4 TaxID=2760942 RepID=UPI0015F8B8D2|nr:hypothetical protein [Shewanella sp. SR43-4]MBB1319162.1 hypothetical protein [Shewanella sp. SR43-4]|tara:strand:- start:4012 stop:4410 length:399 start_codon:yes stop_codon:yes gene_type:complete